MQEDHRRYFQDAIAPILRRVKRSKEMVYLAATEFFDLQGAFRGSPLFARGGPLQQLGVEFPEMLSRADADASIRFCKAYPAQVAVSGANGAGKTSFIEAVLGLPRILPRGDGPVTARILKLTHAPVEQARLEVFASLSAFIDQEIPKVFVDLTNCYQDGDANLLDNLSMRQKIDVHLRRPDFNFGTVEGCHSFREWAECFAVLYLPSVILEAGLDFYDTPGFLHHDQPIIRENVRGLVEKIRPTLAYLYVNSSVDEAARDAFTALNEALSGIDVPWFFLNTHVTLSSLLDADNRDPKSKLTEAECKDLIASARRRKYRLLKLAPEFNALPALAFFENVDECSCFDIIDTVTRDDEMEPQKTAAVTRLLEFTARREEAITIRCVHQVLSGVDIFFDFVMSTAFRNRQQIDKLRQLSETWGERFFADLNARLENFSEQAYDRILRRFYYLQPNLIDRAGKVETCKDGQLQFLGDDIVEPTIRDWTDGRVQTEIIEAGVREAFAEIASAFQRQMSEELRGNFQENVILDSAVQRVLINELEVFDGLPGWAIAVAVIITVLLLPIGIVVGIIALVVKGVVAPIILIHQKRCNIRIDAKFKENICAKRLVEHLLILQGEQLPAGLLKRLPEHAQQAIVQGETFRDALKRELRGKVMELANNFKRAVEDYWHLAVLCLDHGLQIRDVARRFAPQFARVEIILAATESFLHSGGIEPEVNFDERLGQGGFFDVFGGIGTHSHLVFKVLKARHRERPEIAFLEAHYHRKMQRLRIEGLISLEGLYLMPDHRLCIALPRCSADVATFLKTDGTIARLSMAETVEIILPAVKTITLMHAAGFGHRDVKASNLLFGSGGRVLVADFGTVVEDDNAGKSILGTAPLDPQIIIAMLRQRLTSASALSQTYKTKEVDIYSIGILMLEVVQKPQYFRPGSSAQVAELLEELRSNGIDADYLQLAQECLNHDPQLRPTAEVIRDRLLLLQRQYQQPLCMICEGAPRDVRFQCGHKVVCEEHALPFRGMLCPICRVPVESWSKDSDAHTFVLF